MLASFSCLPVHADVTARESTGKPAIESGSLSELRNAPARRIALVIGNGDYRNDALRNPVRDARAMSAMLHALGFDVIRYENATRQQMAEAMGEFSARLKAGGVGLFYFAGHGVEVPGTTMLLPVDSHIASLAHSLGDDALDLQSVLDGMASARPQRLNLVILDTCLNAPLMAPAAGKRMSPALPAQTLVAYATAPGSFAADGNSHGIFTSALLRAMSDSGQELDQQLASAGAAVRAATSGQQSPWVLSSLTAPVRLLPARPELLAQLAPPAETVETLRSRAILPKDSEEQYELAFWESIKDSTHAGDYEAYLKTYPNGRFAALARARIARIRAAEPKAEAPPPASAPAPAAKTPPQRTPPPKPEPKPEPQQARPAAPAPSSPAPAQQAEKPVARVDGVAEIKDCGECPVLVSLPHGAFTMGTNSGDPSEKPAHPVTLGKAFAIGKHEVTVEQWDACVGAGACPRVESSASASKKAPMRDVSWDDAQKYVQWLTKVSGKTYRLPTEAEWEYAARGKTSTRYWWGEQLRPKMANCKECGEPWRKEGPADVGSFAANPFGLHDMNGSVWEWVEDCWHNNYTGAPPDGRAWEQPNCRVRVIRGGSWLEGAGYMPSTTRFKYDAVVRQLQNGFRVARSLE